MQKNKIEKLNELLIKIGTVEAAIEIKPFKFTCEYEGNELFELQFQEPSEQEILRIFNENGTCLMGLEAFRMSCQTNIMSLGDSHAIYATMSGTVMGVAFLHKVRWGGDMYLNLSYPCTIQGKGIGKAMFDHAKSKAIESKLGLWNHAVNQSVGFWENMYQSLDKSQWEVRTKGRAVIWALRKAEEMEEEKEAVQKANERDPKRRKILQPP